MTPNDPFFSLQWHYQLIGDIQTIWDEYNGAGVHVGVYDTGIDIAHPDLAANYDASLHVSFNGIIYAGTPNDSSTVNQSHGTAVAGLIAASGNNGIGVIGGGWGASLTGVNIFDTTSALNINAADKTGFYAALHQMTNFDVINNSWGGQGGFAAWNMSESAEYAYGTVNGRDGLGTVIVQSAGNDNIDAGNSARSASRFTVTVAAAEQSGFSSSYSSYGSSVLVTAPGSSIPGSIVTTDRSGTAGYNTGTTDDGFDGTGNYASNFNGTSAAAPIVTGVVTLMMQANANLGWRDVQNILSVSSTHTGSDIGSISSGLNENGLWKINGGTDWNGGGKHFSIDYGYGMLNSYNAVRMAEAWSVFSSEAKTSSNEQFFTTGTMTASTAFVDNGTTSYSFDVSANIEIEHIDLAIGYMHDNGKQIKFNLIAPDGTISKVVDFSFYGNFAGTFTSRFGLDDLHGQLSAGTWTLQLIDSTAGSIGTVNTVSLNAYGSTPTTNNVYHYTDELSDMAALSGQSGRTVLTDSNGGVDWINAAAVRTASVVNLGAGIATIDGVALTLSGIENVVSGDGKDILTGDGNANRLFGMRGDDVLRGGDGNDNLNGGAGKDALDGGVGADTMEGGTDDDGYVVDNALDVVFEAIGGGNDTLYIKAAAYTLAAGVEVEVLETGDAAGMTAINIIGNEFVQTITGNAGSNRIDGKGGADRMIGLGGNDLYTVDTIGDIIVEGANGGTDGVYASNTSYVLGAGVQVEVLATTNAAGTVALNLVGNEFVQTITGNAASNRIDGKAGADTMIGLGGNDLYTVDTTGDVIVEGANGGTDGVYASNTSYVLGAGVQVEVLATTNAAGTVALNLVGNEFVQTITGNAASNRIDGKAGADKMTGLGGNDLYTVDRIGDIIVEGANGGTDGVYVSNTSYVLGTGVEVEVLATTSAVGTVALNLVGNEFAQAITGNAGVNRLDGKGGADKMTGLGGNDVFVFNSALGGGNIDTVMDFSRAAGNTDKIGLGASVFHQPVGALTAAFFVANASGTAVDGNDTIVYNTTTGALFYDSNGGAAGGATQFGVINGHPSMTASDFIIV